ncbi:unnamed protein product [Musa acuminata subsp. malaccensis]|uniref:WAT1-related protein n=1 Tax=Musa acuminata subsp. malaccensis TaxID=214687 RepID=A0A804KZL5_MUSAM|nr:PREDICTED: WAT1-related protein At4g30420-like [Musa acuminata subsp. malaccensis]CAG1854427.1 unnamed protein product [Musa acuminata subsp. malaccensis]
MADSFLEEYKPGLAMVAVQCIYAAMALSAKAAFTHGMSPMVFVVYRQAIASIVLLPINIITKRGNIGQIDLGTRGFCLVFLASLIGATLNQFFYYRGMDLASSSVATAMTNLIPAITFVMAASLGLEKVKARSLRSVAKVIGTVICVGGATAMAFLKGPRLLSMEFRHLLLGSATDKWVVGALFLIGSSCCWSFWLILQVPICNDYLDPLSLSTWMCLISTFQSATITFFLEPQLSSWKITSLVELLSCLFAGIFGSGVTFYLQSWCISVRGPLFSAMFNPLSTVITTVLALILLHEQLHLGSLVGAVAVVSGLYMVLWGKAKDLDPKRRSQPGDDAHKVTIVIEPKQSYKTDLTKPLMEERAEEAVEK